MVRRVEMEVFGKSDAFEIGKRIEMRNEKEPALASLPP